MHDAHGHGKGKQLKELAPGQADEGQQQQRHQAEAQRHEEQRLEMHEADLGRHEIDAPQELAQQHEGEMLRLHDRLSNAMITPLTFMFRARPAASRPAADG